MRHLLLVAVLSAFLPTGGAEALGVRVSETFGYDPIESTRFLKAALESDAPVVIIDRKDGPWYATPIELSGKGGKTVVFEAGAYVVAKRGEFHGIGPFFSFRRCRDIRIIGAGPDACGVKMWREDYADRSRYAWSEWRHAFSFHSCEHVTIEGLCANESGGDGLYIGCDIPSNGGPCREFVVRNCLFDRNYRQGVSVISVDGLLMENVRMSNTRGAAPEAGIDLEPNFPGEVLRNVVIRNCVCADNRGQGIDMELNKFDATTEPMSVRFENCRATSNANGFRISLRQENWPTGVVTATGCTFEKSRYSGILVEQKPACAVALKFTGCVLDANGTENPKAADINISHLGSHHLPTDGIRFDGLKIRQSAERDWISPLEVNTFPKAITAISGSVDLTRAEGRRETIALTTEWNKKTFPVVLTQPLLPAVAFDPAKALVVDRAPGRHVGTSELLFRGHVRYVFYAVEPGVCEFRGNLLKLGKGRVCPPKSFAVREYPSGRSVGDFAMPPVGEADFAVSVPKTGFYTMDFDMGSGFAHRLVSTSVPVGALAETRLPVWSSVGSLYVNVPNGGMCDLAVIGSSGERIAASVADPSGASIWRKDSIGGWEVCRLTDEGLHALTLSKPSVGIVDDYHVFVTGMPPIAFLSGEKYW